MRFKHLFAAAAAASMTAAPVAAANPAASLSVANAARAGSATKGDSELAGGFAGILAAIVVAGVIAIVAIDASEDDFPDSN